MRREYALQNSCGGFYYYFPEHKGSKACISEENMNLYTKEDAEKHVSKRVEGMKDSDTLTVVKVSVSKV